MRRSPLATATLVPVPTFERLAPWLLRGLWLLTGLAGSAALDGALDGGGSGATATRIVLGLGWVGGVVAMMVPAVRSLTAVRAIVPLSVPAVVAMWIGGADDVDAMQIGRAHV